jgi:hypothetical protein
MKRLLRFDGIRNALSPNSEGKGQKRGNHWMRCSLLASVMLSIPAASFGGVFISVATAPPALPVYAQPVCPGPGYIWTPGYWAYGREGYYWVPGTWVLSPFPGGLWTPGYWGWGGGVYLWHPGYWGFHIGFYGGLNYGFGYFGSGYEGGYWHNGAFQYNRTVNNINVTNIHNTYVKTIISQGNGSRASHNGGVGGSTARPTPLELSMARERHTAATAEQQRHEDAASANRAQLASVNHGNPSVAASPNPGVFSGRGVVAGGHTTLAAIKAETGHRPNQGTQHTAGAHSKEAHPSAVAHHSSVPARHASAPHNSRAPHESHRGRLS